MPGLYQTALTRIVEQVSNLFVAVKRVSNLFATVEQVSNLFLRKPKTSATHPHLLIRSPIR